MLILELESRWKVVQITQYTKWARRLKSISSDVKELLVLYSSKFTRKKNARAENTTQLKKAVHLFEN